MSEWRIAPDGMSEIHYEVGLDGKPRPGSFDPPMGLALHKGLPKIRFEPGWSFWWDQGQYLHWNVAVRPPALKAFDSVSGKPRPISWRYVVDVPNWQRCWDRICNIEYHLAGEHFSVDGTHVMHPHRPQSAYPLEVPA